MGFHGVPIMTRQSLTDLAVRKLQPVTDARYDVWDARVPGLGIRVFPSGVKTFFLSYRIEGRKRRDTLGRYGEISLAEARQLAFERRGRLAKGEDPVVEERAAKLTFGKVVEEFIRLHVRQNNRPRTQVLYEALLKNVFVAAWGEKPIGEIGKREVIAVIDKLNARQKPGMANNAYAVISKLFNWAVSRDVIETSPCAGVERPVKVKSRERVLSDKELAIILKEAKLIGYPYGTIILMLMLTGQRRGEVVNMEWQQIDWDESVWNIPASLAKNKRAHSLPLAKPTLDLLRDVPRINDNKFVFAARGSKATTFSGFSKSKRRFGKETELGDWRLHDLRRTAATGMAKLEVPPHVIERVLNHATGQLGGIAGVYNRFKYLDEMRSALEAWAGHVLALED